MVMVAWAYFSPYPKRHVDRFGDLCRAHDQDRQTNRPRYTPSVTIGLRSTAIKRLSRTGYPSVVPGADPNVQAVSPQVTVSHPPGGRLPLLSARPAVTFPVADHHRPLAGTKLYCLVTEAHGCEQLAQGCYAALPRVGFEPATY